MECFPPLALSWCIENLHFSLFFGVFLSVGLMARRNELAPLLTGGISPLRISRPGILIGVIASTFMCWANHSFLPTVSREMTWSWYSRIEHRQAMADQPITHAIFHNDRGDTFYFGQLYLKYRKGSVIRFISYSAEAGLPQIEIEGAEARWQAGAWAVKDGTARRLDEEGVSERAISELTAKEQRLLSWSLESLIPQHRHLSAMTTSQLKDYRQFLIKMGESGGASNAEIFRRWSASLFPLMFLCISLPFAITADLDRFWIRLFSALLLGCAYNATCLIAAALLSGHPLIALGLSAAWLAVLLGWKMRR
jgi:lipopolysaccharide export LptBFGC system permease protein LptF